MEAKQEEWKKKRDRLLMELKNKDYQISCLEKKIQALEHLPHTTTTTTKDGHSNSTSSSSIYKGKKELDLAAMTEPVGYVKAMNEKRKEKEKPSVFSRSKDQIKKTQVLVANGCKSEGRRDQEDIPTWMLDT